MIPFCGCTASIVARWACWEALVASALRRGQLGAESQPEALHSLSDTDLPGHTNKPSLGTQRLSASSQMPLLAPERHWKAPKTGRW